MPRFAALLGTIQARRQYILPPLISSELITWSHPGKPVDELVEGLHVEEEVLHEPHVNHCF
jgi:hypothetical protein